MKIKITALLLLFSIQELLKLAEDNAAWLRPNDMPS